MHAFAVWMCSHCAYTYKFLWLSECKSKCVCASMTANTHTNVLISLVRPLSWSLFHRHLCMSTAISRDESNIKWLAQKEKKTVSQFDQFFFTQCGCRCRRHLPTKTPLTAMITTPWIQLKTVFLFIHFSLRQLVCVANMWALALSLTSFKRRRKRRSRNEAKWGEWIQSINSHFLLSTIILILFGSGRFWFGFPFERWYVSFHSLAYVFVWLRTVCCFCKILFRFIDDLLLFCFAHISIAFSRLFDECHTLLLLWFFFLDFFLSLFYKMPLMIYNEFKTYTFNVLNNWMNKKTLFRRRIFAEKTGSEAQKTQIKISLHINVILSSLEMVFSSYFSSSHESLIYIRNRKYRSLYGRCEDMRFK